MNNYNFSIDEFDKYFKGQFNQVGLELICFDREDLESDFITECIQYAVDKGYMNFIRNERDENFGDIIGLTYGLTRDGRKYFGVEKEVRKGSNEY